MKHSSSDHFSIVKVLKFGRGGDLEELSASFNTLKPFSRCLYTLAGCLLTASERKYLAREWGYRGCAGNTKYLNSCTLFRLTVCSVRCSLRRWLELAKCITVEYRAHHLQLVLIVRIVMHISDVMIRITSFRRESAG